MNKKLQIEEMGSFFNQRAVEYDRQQIKNIDKGKACYQVIADFIPEGTKSLLDLGCGTGMELESMFCRFSQILEGYRFMPVMKISCQIWHNKINYGCLSVGLRQRYQTMAGQNCIRLHNQNSLTSLKKDSKINENIGKSTVGIAKK